MPIWIVGQHVESVDHEKDHAGLKDVYEGICMVDYVAEREAVPSPLP